MKDNLSLFPKKEGRDNYRWQAYLSSALTIDKEDDRARILALNAKIKQALEDKTGTFVYLPQEYSDPSRGDKMKPEEIYVLDRWRIAESDFVILNLDRPAFGVGQEAEIATSMSIPVIAFHYRSIKVSRIITGVPVIFLGEGLGVPSDSVISYSDLEIYSDLMGSLIAEVTRLQKTITPLEEITPDEFSFSKNLQRLMDSEGVAIDELARRTDFTLPFIKHLLSNFDSVKSTLEPYEILARCRMRRIPEDRFVNPGLWVLRKLSKALGRKVYELIGEREIGHALNEPLRIAGKKGVALEEFVNVASDVGYHLIVDRAARSQNETSSVLADEIVQAVERRRAVLAKDD